jgi:hypothetical protein
MNKKKDFSEVKHKGYFGTEEGYGGREEHSTERKVLIEATIGKQT